MSTATMTTERKLPPVTELAVATIALTVVGGIYMAAHLPKHFSLAFPIADVAVCAALVLANVVLLSRTEGFAWRTFFLVGKWALVAYSVISGMLVYVFARDHTPAGPMTVLALFLVIWAIDIPMLLAFTVARYAEP
jgi:CDP-diglyceride synthetase